MFAAVFRPITAPGGSLLRWASQPGGGQLYVVVAGVERATGRLVENAGILHESLVVTETSNPATPNRCDFTAFGFAPSVGDRVVVALGSSSSPDRLFAGLVLAVTQSYVGTPTNARYSVSCVDDSFLLNQRKVIKRYVSQSATDIVTNLVSTFSTGFTTTNVEAGLETIDEITFTNEGVVECLQRVAKRIGATCRIDQFADVHFYTGSESGVSAPATLVEGVAPPLESFSASRDLSQVITRVYVEGGGPQVLGEVAVGETIIPVQDTSWFNASGGTVVSGPQRLTYTGVDTGGGGGLVGPGASPSSAPAGALANGSGVNTGLHGYAVTFVTGAGESIAGPSLSITTGAISAPSAAPTAGSPTVGSGVTTGDHQYAVTFVNSGGETTTSPLSGVVSPGPVTTGSISDPGSAPSKTVSTTTGNLLPGGRTHAVTFYNGAGETLASPTVASTINVLSNGSSLNAYSPTAGGSVDDGNHAWSFTFVSASGESDEKATSGLVATGGGNNTVPLDTLGISDPRATHIKIYRSLAGTSAPRYLVATVAVSTSTISYNDTASDASISGGPQPPSTDTASTGSIDLSNIPIGGTGTTGRKVYRTVAGGSQLKLVATIANNSATTYTDNTADASLGADVPTTNTTAATTNYNVVPLSSIPLGPACVTSRKLYRTAAGGSQMKYLATLADNTTTTYSDSIADGSLGSNIPTSNTATANQVSLSSIPIGGASVTSRKVYRTAAAGSQLKLLTTIADNTTTTYTDSTADASLGANVPTSDTSGLAQPTGQILAGSTSLIMTGLDGMPSAGWAVIGNGAQVIRYTGKSSSALTGIPASGVGAITASIAYNSTATAPPILTGVPSSSTGSVLYAVPKGDAINLLVTVDDVPAQAVLAALVGGDGIREDYLQDRRLSEEEARARGTAHLELRSAVEVKIKWRSRDQQTRAGRVISVNLAAPFSVSADFLIQQVTISGFTPAQEPIYQASGSSTLFTFEELLRLTRAA